METQAYKHTSTQAHTHTPHTRLAGGTRGSALSTVPRSPSGAWNLHVLGGSLCDLLDPQRFATKCAVELVHSAIATRNIADCVTQLLLYACLFLERVVGPTLQLGQLHLNQAGRFDSGRKSGRVHCCASNAIELQQCFPAPSTCIRRGV